jgi:hypothetical protein
MNHTTLGNIIRARIASVPEVDSGEIEVQYDNVQFKPRNHSYWVRASIREGESRSATLGATLHRTVGVVILQLFAPLDEGDGTLRDYADTFKAHFNSVDVSGVAFYVPSVNTIGRTKGWWQINVSCPFYVDD